MNGLYDKEIAQLQPGDWGIIIEYCSNCKEHNNSLWHDELKYKQRAEELKTKLEHEFTFFKIWLRPIQTSTIQSNKRLGLFEVVMCSLEMTEPKIFASKLQTLKWPEIRVILNNIRSYFNGKRLYITLRNSQNAGFHPLNKYKESIRLFLVAECDLILFREKIENEENKIKQKPNTTKNNKECKNSSKNVSKLNEKGQYSKLEIYPELLHSPEFIFERKVDENMNLEFSEVKPGSYKLIILENNNFERIIFDVKIEVQIRVQDFPMKMELDLVPKKSAYVDIYLQFMISNPVYKSVFKMKKTEIQKELIEYPLIAISTTSDEIKKISYFNIKNALPGNYTLNFEFKNYEMFNEEIFITPGVNLLSITYPRLECVYFLNPFKQIPLEMQNSGQIIVQNQKTLETNARVKKQIKDETRRNLIGNVQSKKNDVLTPISNNIEEKENNVKKDLFYQNNVKTPIKKKSRVFKIDSSQKKTMSIIPKSKMIQLKIDEMINSNKSNFKKESSFSKMKIKSQLSKDPSFDVPNMLNQKLSLFQDDPFIKLLKTACLPNTFNVFIQKNSIFKVEFEFLLNQNEIEGINSDESFSFCQQLEINNEIDHFQLKFIPNFEFGRLYISKLDSSQNEFIDLIIIHEQELSKVDLNYLFNDICDKEEVFCDIALIVPNADQMSFISICSLVPMIYPLDCLTGLSDLLTLVLLTEKKVGNLLKWFGFKNDENNKKKMISREQIFDILSCHQIEFDSDYIFNAIRVKKDGSTSRDKIIEVYELWCKISISLENLDLEDEDVFLQSEKNASKEV